MELLSLYLLFASALLFIGVLGLTSSNNAIRLLLSSELLYNASILVLLSLALKTPIHATTLSIMIVILATSEVAVLVAIVVLFYRSRRLMDLSVMARKEGV